MTTIQTQADARGADEEALGRPAPPMGLSRRRLLRIAAVASAGAAVASAGAVLAPLSAADARAARALAAHVRPEPVGTSTTRCAACGSPDHGMLGGHCSRRPHVLRRYRG
jgi:hypothetical protein